MVALAVLSAVARGEMGGGRQAAWGRGLLDWHVQDHCSFFEVVTAGASPTALHPTQDADAATNASVFSEVSLVAPDGSMVPARENRK